MILLIEKKIKTSKECFDKLCSLWSLTKTEMDQTRKVVQAFSLSMKKNYPVIPKDWKLITVYRAAEILKGYLSRNTIDSYKKLDWLRNKNGQLYLEEIVNLKQGFDAVGFMEDNGLMGTEKIDGRKYIVAYPTQVAHLKAQPIDQKVRGFAKFIRTGWFQDWMDYIDLSE